MTLMLRFLRMRALTDQGMFGADIPLEPGLTVIRAENSRGKSTAIKSLLYVLGMERMITARSASTVTAAMRDSLIYDSTSKAETRVLESYVSLEISNSDGRVVTLTRWVKHESILDGLIRVTDGPLLTDPGSYESTDYYVGRGSVANPRGFHSWLAAFIGWTMPQLPARDGNVAPLYMEQVFPLLFVEQRRGWGGIQAQMPYFSGVSDVRRRAIEFLLGLDVGQREVERQQITAEIRNLESRWQASVGVFEQSIQGEGLSTSGLPKSLSLTWPPAQPVVLLHASGDSWITIEEEIERLRLMAPRGSGEVPRVGEIADEEEAQLDSALQRSEQLQEMSNLLREQIIRDQAELAAVQEKLDALREDHRQYQDILVLERLGSTSLSRLDDDCPVCHQRLPASLLGTHLANETMSAEESVAFIKQQIQLFEVMAQDSRRSLDGRRERWASVRTQSADVRSEIRRLRTDLLQREDTPSVEYVAEQFVRDQRLQQLQSIRERFDGVQGELMRLAQDAAALRSRLNQLPKDRLSDEDKEKLNLLESSFVAQLRGYDFGSFSDERLTVSREDYLPRRDDFDLQADISASDSIRVVWAYLLALMEVAISQRTNHPGLLIFDEPRQQSTKGLSFQALLTRAARDAVGGQIVFATSEDLSALRRMLEGIDCKLLVIDGYLLKPINR